MANESYRAEVMSLIKVIPFSSKVKKDNFEVSISSALTSAEASGDYQEFLKKADMWINALISKKVVLKDSGNKLKSDIHKVISGEPVVEPQKEIIKTSEVKVAAPQPVIKPNPKPAPTEIHNEAGEMKSLDVNPQQMQGLVDEMMNQTPEEEVQNEPEEPATATEPIAEETREVEPETQPDPVSERTPRFHIASAGKRPAQGSEVNEEVPANTQATFPAPAYQEVQSEEFDAAIMQLPPQPVFQQPVVYYYYAPTPAPVQEDKTKEVLIGIAKVAVPVVIGLGIGYVVGKVHEGSSKPTGLAAFRKQ